jgi:small subunit ribosomal protein S2
MNRIPSAVFIVDVMKEHIALAEAKKLGIPVIAMVDTNSDPRPVDFPIPANDDASKSIKAVVDAITAAIKEGLAERGSEKEAPAAEAAPAEEAPAAAEAAPAEETPAEEAPAAAEAAPAEEAPAEEEKADDKEA